MEFSSIDNIVQVRCFYYNFKTFNIELHKIDQPIRLDAEFEIFSNKLVKKFEHSLYPDNLFQYLNMFPNVCVI